MCIVSANRNFLEKGQRTLANTIGYRLEEVFPTVIIDQIDIAKRIRQAIENNQPAKGERMTYRAPGVPIRIYYYSILPFTWQGRVEGAVLFMDDVTEQVRLSEEVRQVERHLASIVESASDLVLSTDKKGRILTWNAAAERLSGYPAAETREHDFTDFCTDEDRKDIQNIFSRIDTRKYARQMKEYPLRTIKGAFIPVSWVFSPLKDSSNQTAGVVAVGRDLTEKRKFEMELHQSQPSGLWRAALPMKSGIPWLSAHPVPSFLWKRTARRNFAGTARKRSTRASSGPRPSSRIFSNILILPRRPGQPWSTSRP
jgi:PAS domain S-box-containing protein